MARVTRIERPADLHPGTNGHHPEQHGADADTAPLQVVRQRTSISDSWRAFGAVAICFAIVLLLNSKSFVKIAEAKSDGPARSVLLVTARGLDSVASAVRLDRLNSLIDTALNRQDAVPRFDPAPAPAAPQVTATASTVPAPVDISAIARDTSSSTAPTTPGTADTVSPARNAPPTPIAPAAAPSTGLRTVTTSNQLRVYIAGDSFVEWLGYDLADDGKRDGYLTTRLDAKISSGLARPDYFDWPARITQAMAGDPRPEAVVFFAGANDDTDMHVDSGTLARGTPAWSAEYGRRAGALMDIVGRGGAQFYWVGQPIMRDKARANVAADVNTTVMAEAAKRPWVHFIDTWSMFADANGNYAVFLPGPDGELVRVRQDEGIHLTRAGTTWVSEAVYKAIRRDWKIP